MPGDTASQKARPMRVRAEHVRCRIVSVKERIVRQDVMVCKESPNASSSSQQHLWWQLWRRTAGCGAKNEANGYQPRAGRRSSQQTSTNEQLRQCGSHCGVAGTFQHGTACDARRCACSCRVCWANTRRLIAWRVRASTCVCVQLARDAGEQLLRWVVHVWGLVSPPDNLVTRD